MTELHYLVLSIWVELGPLGVKFLKKIQQVVMDTHPVL